MSKKEIYPRVGRMHNPPHPGAVLKEMFMLPARTTVTDMAARLEVDRKTVSRIVNGKHGITAEMALRLGRLLNTSPNMWLGMQQAYDLWQAEQKCREDVGRIRPYTADEIGHMSA